MKFPIKDFFSKCDRFLPVADLVTFTEEILNEKLCFFCAVIFYNYKYNSTIYKYSRKMKFYPKDIFN